MGALADTHEHMGQMIAYTRINGMSPPWPDWRTGARSSSFVPARAYRKDTVQLEFHNHFPQDKS